MCGRYYTDIEDTELREIITAAENNVIGHEQPVFKGGEVFPGTVAPVLAKSGAVFMKWGFPDYTGKRPHINARSETAETARTFRQAWAERRCLIPASGYFEWKTLDAKHKEKYSFSLTGTGLMYIAGIYSGDGRFAILTRAAAPALSEIHDRMPVIIPKPLTDVWLRESPEVYKEALTDLRFSLSQNKR